MNLQLDRRGLLRRKAQDARVHARWIWAQCRTAFQDVILGREFPSLEDAPDVVAHVEALLQVVDTAAHAREAGPHQGFPALSLLEEIGPSRAFFAAERLLILMAGDDPAEFHRLSQQIELELAIRVHSRRWGSRSWDLHPAGRGLRRRV